METYKIIEGHENYSVSDFGNVKNNKTGRILKPGLGSNKYLSVVLTKSIDKSRSTHNIHRLVVEKFIQNTEKKKCVDHIDNKRTNNKLSNLRWATYSQNEQNKGKSKKNTSGVKGVSFNNYLNKWHAYINIDGIRVNLGCFENLEDAKQAQILKVNEAFGAFTNKIEKNE